MRQEREAAVLGKTAVMTPIAPGTYELVHRFVDRHFQHADTVVVGGSTATGTNTPSSDIDLLIFGADVVGAGRTSLAATYEQEGRLFEVFAYSVAGYREWGTRELAWHRPVILRMLQTGVVVKQGPAYDELAPWAAAVLAAGPQVDQQVLDACRYRLTSQLDDLADSVDPAERSLLHAAVFASLAEFLLLANGQWLGSDKWLVRVLREWDRKTADALCAALVSSDRAALSRTALTHLEPFGGPLRAGFVR